MRIPVVVNGLGCFETGAQIVFSEIVMSAPKNVKVVAFCTSETAKKLVGGRWGRLSPNILVVGLSHSWFGRLLRVPWEFFIGLLAASRVAEVVNLSHYGLCLGGDYVLYIHSPVLMATDAAAGWGDGKPNYIKQSMLRTCLRRASRVLLQTEGMARQCEQFCHQAGIKNWNQTVIFPRVDVPVALEGRRDFAFQLFYPTSRFQHKRIELAEDAARLCHKTDPELGLVITTEPAAGRSAQEPGLLQIGRISREQVQIRYAGSDALLFTSERETLGLPLLEALEYGLPVIAPKLPYATELLGDAGCYFEGEEPDAVARAIRECRLNHSEWRRKSRERARYIQIRGRTWADHWQVFLEKSSCEF